MSANARAMLMPASAVPSRNALSRSRNSGRSQTLSPRYLTGRPFSSGNARRNPQWILARHRLECSQGNASPHSPITCTTSRRARGPVSKSMKTICCHGPSVSRPPTKGTVSDEPISAARTWRWRCHCSSGDGANRLAVAARTCQGRLGCLPRHCPRTPAWSCGGGTVVENGHDAGQQASLGDRSLDERGNVFRGGVACVRR